MRSTKAPLYRTVNTVARNVHHDTGGDFRRERARAGGSDEPRGSMHGTKRRGLDYTPLFRFLLSRVGERFDDVFREAISRLDRPDPIWWLVARTEQERQPSVRVDESTYWSGLFVDAEGRLQRVDPGLTVEQLEPSCPCCTHTFNGARFTRKYRDPPR